MSTVQARLVGVPAWGTSCADFASVTDALAWAALHARHGRLSRDTYLCVSGLDTYCRHFGFRRLND